MPSPERVQQFIDMVVSGDHVRAIADFYHPDATMQENLNPPRRGRDHLMRHEQAALDKIAAVHTHPDPVVLVDGDFVAVNWTFDMTDRKDVTRRLVEIAFQRWDGDRIAEERFYYDTGSAWRVVEGPDRAA